MNLAELCRKIDFKERGDKSGKLIAIESLKDIPFEIKRIFYIYGVSDDKVRGQHANKNSEFVMINLSGKCKVRLSDSKEETIVELNKPNEGLYIPKMIWKDMYDFSKDAVMLVLTNTYYDNAEYIRDYEEYKEIMVNYE